MKTIAERLTIEEHNGKQIIFVDFKGLKEKEMIELAKNHLELTLKTKLPFLADYHNTYGTSGFMVQARNFAETTKNIIDKGALLGISKVKSILLKGAVFFIGVNYKAFDNREEAIRFLTTENYN